MNNVNEAVRNPYRIKKPSKKEVIARIPCQFYNESNRPCGYDNLLMTSQYLWVSRELSIPIPSIINLELDDKRKRITITYANVLEKQEEKFVLGCIGFLVLSKKKTLAFHETLTKMMAESPSAEEFFLSDEPDKGNVQIGCESCGSPEAKNVELCSFFCVGFFPILGAYKWEPTVRYLCEEHAGKKCFTLSLVTALVGYLGFPGIFVAPFRVYKNISALKKVGFDPGVYGSLTYIVGIVLPISGVALLVYLIITNS